MCSPSSCALTPASANSVAMKSAAVPPSLGWRTWFSSVRRVSSCCVFPEPATRPSAARSSSNAPNTYTISARILPRANSRSSSVRQNASTSADALPWSRSRSRSSTSRFATFGCIACLANRSWRSPSYSTLTRSPSSAASASACCKTAYAASDLSRWARNSRNFTCVMNCSLLANIVDSPLCAARAGPGVAVHRRAESTARYLVSQFQARACQVEDR